LIRAGRPGRDDGEEPSSRLFGNLSQAEEAENGDDDHDETDDVDDVVHAGSSL
jgi:hypothetical protein